MLVIVMNVISCPHRVALGGNNDIITSRGNIRSKLLHITLKLYFNQCEQHDFALEPKSGYTSGTAKSPSKPLRIMYGLFPRDINKYQLSTFYKLNNISTIVMIKL